MRLNLPTLSLLLLICASTSWSSPPFSQSGNARWIQSIVREALQNQNAGVGNGATNCALCHTNAPALNADFGTDFRQALLVTGAANPPNTSQAQMVMAVAGTLLRQTDSDNDGFNNDAEFRANTNPNDPNSRPTPGGTTTTTTRVAPPPPPVGGAAPDAMANDPEANKLSGGCSGGGQASIEDPHRGTRAKVWFALCLFPFIAGLVTRRLK